MHIRINSNISDFLNDLSSFYDFASFSSDKKVISFFRLILSNKNRLLVTCDEVFMTSVASSSQTWD